jgi:small subunit ribosomal protein S18
MPRKTNTDRSKKGGRNANGKPMERRTPRPAPKVDFTIDQLDYRNVTLLRRYVTDHGRILLRKYTGLPAAFQRQLSRSVKRARQMLLMK